MHHGVITTTIDEEGYYHSGDIVKYNTKNKLFYFVAREKFMFTSYGTNIYPKEIETHLEKINEIQSAVVVPIIDPIGGSVPIAFISTYTPIMEKDIKDLLQNKIHERKIPKAIIFIKEFPTLGNGKVDRSYFIKKTKNISIKDLTSIKNYNIAIK